MELSKREKRKLRFQSAHQGEEPKIEHTQQIPEKKSGKKYYVLGSILAIVLLIIVYSVYSVSKPGMYDGFAKCLSEKGAVMYGAMDWCKYTQAQKGMFGKSFKYVNYREYKELPGIKKTPTWVINGVWYENTQSFDKLSQLTGCQIR